MSKNRTATNTFKLLTVVFLCVSLFLSAVLSVLYIKEAPPQKLLTKLGLMNYQTTDWSLISWNSSLEQLDYDADIVFIGDSLTCGENFQEYFPKSKVINLGLSGDSILGVSNRSSVISHFTPEKIFIECGINSLSSIPLEAMADQYESMVSKLTTENPDAQIYIQSVFPISKANESGELNNQNIIAFNEELKTIADTHSAIYVDIYSHYVEDGQMNSEYTKDGIHLKDEYKHIWLDVLSEYI